MKTKIITMAFASAVTMAVALPLPAAADPTALSDGQLDAVSGKANNSSTAGVDTTSITGLNSMKGNVQVGYYQWDDLHDGDSSINKGGNVQNGDNSMVQQNAAVIANQMAWGGAAQSITDNAADIGGSQTAESWWIMYLGGF